MDLKGRVVIFSLPTCGYCRRAKAKLLDLGIPYYDINVQKYPEKAQKMRDQTGRKTVPQIFFNAIHVGGWDELQKLIDEGQLDELLREVEMNEPPEDAPQPIPSDEDDDDEDMSNDLSELSCEPDEYALLVREVKNSRLVKDHRYHLRSYKSCFVGQELVDWLVKNKNMNRSEATEMGRELMKRNFCHHVADDHEFKDEYLFYRFVEDKRRSALNMSYVTDCEPHGANVISEHLRHLILQLYADHLSQDGKAVDYEGMGRNPKFASYVKATAQLQRVDVNSLSREEKIAFFINIYNALVIHANVARGPPTNIWQRYKFFNYTSYIIGGYLYCLQDIENGVLRANRRGIAQFRRPFGSKDPRRKIALNRHEPRIHFALVCGAKSCPPIKTYSAQNVDAELQLATEAFLDGEGCVIDMEKKEVSLSMILKWYKVDFGANTEELLKWIAAHTSPGGKNRAYLLQLIQEKSYKVTYQPYNWDLNSS
ncbi:uncharacterized protein LOC134182807 [Corticium candelabrum]|uniref:uncharacterized protein LOC134182807 n=1 Tax=Corticium candelabrum TaxID=121492 RepID=UPI002E25C8F4|nr:uncharacterized protein LOC134182807 [Corticium candelabrum]